MAIRLILPPLVTCLIGAWLINAGVSMPRPRGWSSAPGLFPVVIGAVLVCLGAALFAENRARREPAPPGPAGARGVMRALLPLAVIPALALYVLALGRFPFEPTTFVFLCAMMPAFGERRIWKIVLAASLFTLIVTLLFTQVLQTLLPGTYSVIEALFY